MTSDPASKALSATAAVIWTLLAITAWVGYALKSDAARLLGAILTTAAAALWLAGVVVAKRRERAPRPTGKVVIGQH